MKYIDIQEDDGEDGQDGNQFWEILFDENLARGGLCFSDRIIRETGGINRKLKAKQAYELLLRAADGRSLCIEECDDKKGIDDIKKQNCLIVEDMPDEDAWEGIRTDCYIVGRYRDRIINQDCLYEVIESILQQAREHEFQDDAISFLEEMLLRRDSYYKIADDTEPILIYRGDSVCYNILNVFAEQFGAALREKYQRVEYFDQDAEGVNAITRLVGRHFKAIVGFQSCLYSVKRTDGTYVHDDIFGPKYDFTFDHPIELHSYVKNEKDVCYLCQDENHVKFIQRYYERKAVLFPSAGMMDANGQAERIYDISFVGTYGDYWQEAQEIHRLERKTRFLANHFLLRMRKKPNLPAENALKEVLEERGWHYADKEFLDIFYQTRNAMFCVMKYYRYKVVKTLLEGGLRVDVFGNGWIHTPLSRYHNLACHPDIAADKAALIYRQSKCSLNVMSWHKAGFTERMAGIMLNGAVLVTDKTTYIESAFDTGKDMIVFDLEKIEQLPEKVRLCLNNSEMRDEMAEKGKRKAVEGHTWDKRAGQFLDEVLETS